MTVWGPTPSVPTASESATPAVGVTGSPRLEPSTTNWTAPPAVPAPGGTGATGAGEGAGCPKSEGLAEEPPVVLGSGGFAGGGQPGPRARERAAPPQTAGPRWTPSGRAAAAA